MIVENVRGAQPWVGRAKANFGSYYLWGDVGMVGRRVVAGVPRFGVSVQPMSRQSDMKCPNESWNLTRPAYTKDHTWKRNPDGTDHGSGRKNADTLWRENGCNAENRMVPSKVPGILCTKSSKSNSRKAASAQIAKIPFPLAQYIARTFGLTPNAKGTE